MTEEELREKIAEIINEGAYRVDYSLRRVAYQILTLIREAGWKSPTEIESLVFQAILYADKEQAVEILKKGGWKSPEEVKELA